MDTTEKLLDIHTHQKFFTFQLPTKDANDTNVVTYIIDPRNASKLSEFEIKTPTQENDLLLRLRAALHAARADSVDQGMRVTVTEI